MSELDFATVTTRVLDAVVVEAQTNVSATVWLYSAEF